LAFNVLRFWTRTSLNFKIIGIVVNINKYAVLNFSLNTLSISEICRKNRAFNKNIFRLSPRNAVNNLPRIIRAITNGNTIIIANYLRGG